jgi:hypothetical protein
MLIGPVIASLVLSLAVGTASWLGPATLAAPAVPDEPGALMLPERQTYQAVVADLDGRRSRDLVRLVHGVLGSIQVEVWRHGASGWARVGGDLEVIPELANGSQANLIYAGTPARLIVRVAEGREHVTIVRQPRFADRGDGPPCCLHIHDIVIVDDEPRLRQVGSATTGVDAVLALDLDGDGTDELLATRSLPPLGRTAYPMEAYVYRWDGDRFGEPTLTTLPVGSGNVPFVLGDTDGLPGVEAGIITTAAQGVLYRLVLGPEDTLRAESSGVVVQAATAVPIGDERGVALIGPLTGLAVHPWPPGSRLGESAGRRDLTRGRFVELIELQSGPALLVEQSDPVAVHVLSLPSLAAAPGITLTRSPGAASLDRGPLDAYRGPLPRGGLDGGPAAIYAGHLLPAAGAGGPAPFPALEVAGTVAFGGAEPIGLAGPGRGWLALLHGGRSPAPLDPLGGRLDAPALRAASGIALVPLALAQQEERDFGQLALETRNALELDPRGTLAVGRAGFVAVVRAPPGSRVYVSDTDPSVIAGTRLVPAAGELEIPLPPPAGATPNPGYRASLTVVSPAGASYAASWTVRTLIDAPPLVAETETRLASAAVDVRGMTAPYATVTVDGRAVTVDPDGTFGTAVELPPWPTEIAIIATDPIGNATTLTVTGVGLLEYRALPWAWIALVPLLGIAVLMALRAPRPLVAARRADDDGVLEDLDPD